MTLSRRTLLGGTLAAASLAAGRPLAAGLAIATPPQTLGPFYPVTKPPDRDADLTRIQGVAGRAAGDIIDVAGLVVDRHGRIIRSALVEIWQCNAFGRYDHPRGGRDAPLDPSFQGYGQDVTDEAGGYWFRTIKPPPYPASANWMRPSHIHFRVVAPGAGTLVTQMSFAGDSYLARDYIFNDIADPAARANLVVTLVANPMTLPDDDAPPMASFEIRLA